MKILAIRIKNLASIDGITEIDFTREPLCSAGIFAITGPTGAGKSTILDALCLALYAKTPRYLQAKETGVAIQDIPGITINQGDVRGILRDGTGDGFAEVDFIGIDGSKYRAKWSVNRARGKMDGAMQNENLSILNIETGIVLASKKSDSCREIERLVGLNFEQFTRSVLLAQGDFTAFLKADKDEKASLLEKLTGTHIYSEISRQVFIKCKEEDTTVQELKKQLDSVNIFTEEQVNNLLERKKALEKVLAEYERTIALVGAGINWYERLVQLDNSMQQAVVSLNKAKDDLNQASGRINKFKLIEHVQQVRTEIESINATKKNLQEDERALNTALLEVDKINIKISALDISINDARSSLSIAKEKKENAIPRINEAKELDVRIKEKKSHLQHAFNEVEIAETKYKQQVSELNGKQQEHANLFKEIDELKNWKEDNLEREPIAENITLINSKLVDAKKLLDGMEAIENQLAIFNNKNAGSNRLIFQLQEQHNINSEVIKELRSKCEALEKKLSTESIESIEIEKANTDKLTEELLAAQSHWKLLYADKEKIRLIKLRIAEEKTTLSTDLKKLAGIKEGLSSATEKKSSSEKRLHRAQLQVAEDVEELRSSLVEGEECPVCGSIHHPYAFDQPVSNGIIRMLADELIADQQLFDRLYSEHVALQSSCNLSGTFITQLENELHELQRTVAEQEEGWTKFTICKPCNELLEEEVTGWIQQKMDASKKSQKELTEKIHIYRTNKNILDREKQSLYQSEVSLVDLRHQLESENKNVHSINERIEELNKQKDHQQSDLKIIVDRLDSYFVNKTWLENWKSAPVEFLDLITQFDLTWKNKLRQLESGNNKLKTLEKDIEHLESLKRSCKEDKENKQAIYDRITLENNDLIDKRKFIFNGEPISKVEQQLQHAINEAQETVDSLLNDKQQAGNQLAASNERVSHLRKAVEHHSINIDNLTILVNTWISNYNKNNSSLVNIDIITELLTYSHEWIQSERHALKEMDDAITQCNSILQERDLQLKEHSKNKLTEQTLDELLEAQKSINEKRSLAGSEEMEIGIQLKHDQENKKKAQKLVDLVLEKQAIAENWSKLNEMIGSADGKKFRQVAQEYTLDVLLGYANFHLDGLTKRYQLQRIPCTLSLQVLDKDMGDEVRTVYSLSGGESFLVSLALALGLASLSSSRMKVESLFIDEGFGSLDPVTLNIAMDALERLHNQGRKVGVISHVQEMTERIPTQIKVTKLSSGKSKIEIDGILHDL